MEDKRLCYTVSEASKRIGVSEPVLRQAIKAGKVPHLILGKRKIFIPIAALEKWLAGV